MPHSKTRGAPYPDWDDLIDADGAGPISSIEAIATYLEANMAGWLKGTTAGRPAAGPAVEKFLYWDEDTAALSFCVGGAWRQIPLGAPDLSGYLLKSGGTMTGLLGLGVGASIDANGLPVKGFMASGYGDTLRRHSDFNSVVELTAEGGATPEQTRLLLSSVGTATVTIVDTFANLFPVEGVYPFLFIIEDDPTITWPVQVDWIGGSAPTFTDNTRHLVVITYYKKQVDGPGSGDAIGQYLGHV